MPYVGKVKLWKRGQMTLPVKLRKKLGMDGEAILSVYEMGRCIVLTPDEPVLDRLSEEVQDLMDREGVTLEDMLAALAEDRRGDAEPPALAARRAIEADRYTEGEPDTAGEDE
ncbi:MAG: AbrB/MazE/SpoVT family DNA-binding domain-containing protein [Armatimonadota bacterium]